MSYIYLQEQGEESSADIFWVIPASAQSRLKNTAAMCFYSASAMESCPDSPFGMMCVLLTAERGEDPSMSSVEDSPVKTSAQPAEDKESPESDQDCGPNRPESFARWNPHSSSWRTRQCSLLGGLELYSETWPRWGMMRDGECSELMTLEPHTSERESGYLPTPTASSYGKNKSKSDGAKDRLSLNSMATQNKWPTPTARDWKGANSKEGLIRKDGKDRMSSLPNAVKFEDLDNPVGGQLNPEWVAWLMGWPIGWTDLKPLEMDKFQQWQRMHGIDCLTASPEQL